jgi:cyclase
MSAMKCVKQVGLAFAAVAMAGAAGAALGPAALAQGPQGPQPVKVMPVRDNVYWAQGGIGSNTGIIVGTDGVILFDPKGSPESAKDVLAEVAKITPLPVTTVIVSHSNPDHTKGLPGYAPGTTIIAQQNAARDIEALTFYMTWTGMGGDRAGNDKPYLPTQTVDTRANVKLNGVNLELLHWAPAHTNGDLVLYLPDQKIAFTGDLFGPNVHLENGGSSEGMIESLRGLVALDCDTYVRGHLPIGTKADMQKILDDLVARRTKIISLYDSGKSVEEAEQAMGEKVVPRSTTMIPGLKPFRPARDMNFTEIVYEEMSRR